MPAPKGLWEHGAVRDSRPLIAHIVFRFDYGGLENGIVNLVNGLPADEFRHAIIALSEASAFRERVRREDVEVYELRKRQGQDPAAYVRLFRLLRRLRPAIVHTRNVGTIDCAAIAALAAVRIRLHGEHGWDTHDPDGLKRKYKLMRRLFGALVNRFVAVSKEIEHWLCERVGISAARVTRICNGVDMTRFRSDRQASDAELPSERFPPGSVVIGSVTRFTDIKDPLNLVRAFIEIRARGLASGADVRLLMIGDGPLRQPAQKLLDDAQQAHAAWLAGSRDDVPEMLRHMHVFALASRREGISNTVLEAMASSLPVVASATGGNLELVVPGICGALVPSGDSHALAAALATYASDPNLRREHGAAARARVEAEYSLARMLADYRDLYRTQISRLGMAT